MHGWHVNIEKEWTSKKKNPEKHVIHLLVQRMFIEKDEEKIHINIIFLC